LIPGKTNKPPQILIVRKRRKLEFSPLLLKGEK